MKGHAFSHPAASSTSQESQGGCQSTGNKKLCAGSYSASCKQVQHTPPVWIRERMEGHTNQKHSSPLVCSFAFPGPSYRQSTRVWKQAILLRYRQKVNSSQLPSHSAYIVHLTAPHHADVLSSHIVTRRASTEQYFERKNTHNFYYSTWL